MRVGKHELLAWVADLSGAPCTSFEDLKSGVALLGVCSRVFPRLSERRFRMKLAPRYEWEQGLNWESVGQMMAAVKLPSELFDKGGLQACRFKPLYNFLVTLFFLHHVAADADFTADFTHPIDGPVAAYLQSRGAVETLIAGGAVSPDVLPGATPGRAAPPKPSGRREREAAPPPASPTRSVSSVASELVAERPLEVRRISDSSEIRQVPSPDGRRAAPPSPWRPPARATSTPPVISRSSSLSGSAARTPRGTPRASPSASPHRRPPSGSPPALSSRASSRGGSVAAPAPRPAAPLGHRHRSVQRAQAPATAPRAPAPSPPMPRSAPPRPTPPSRRAGVGGAAGERLLAMNWRFEVDRLEG